MAASSLPLVEIEQFGVAPEAINRCSGCQTLEVEPAIARADLARVEDQHRADGQRAERGERIHHAESGARAFGVASASAGSPPLGEGLDPAAHASRNVIETMADQDHRMVEPTDAGLSRCTVGAT